MRINHNAAAVNTYSKLSSAQGAQAKSLEKLSSGLRINRAGDDAAGLAISEKMRGQISGLTQASRNAQDGISLIQTAEGGLNETHSILQRMRELAVQSSNDTNTDEDRIEIQKEMNQLSEEVTRISSNTQFNSKNLLDGDFSAKFHIGANKGQNMQLEVSDMSAQALKVSGSGEGKATYEVSVATATQGTTVGSLENGTQTLDVVKLDNVAMTGINANYGLADSDGKIVAVSNDGQAYKLLEKATDKAELATAAQSDGTIDFLTGNKVIGGQVTLEATNDASGIATGITNVEATATKEVEGLGTGTFTVATFAASHTTETWTTGPALSLLNENGDAVAVGNNTDGFFALKDLTLAGTGNVYATVTGGEEASITFGSAVANGQVYEVKANGGIDVSSQVAADAAIKTIDDAITTVSAERSKLGAVQNRLDHTINNLTATSENLSAAESRIRDVDMAKEMMNFTKNNILSQAGTAMLAQANQMPQGVLQLLG